MSLSSTRRTQKNDSAERHSDRTNQIGVCQKEHPKKKTGGNI